jgi:hypothetical protein
MGYVEQINGQKQYLDPRRRGTKASPYYKMDIPAEGSKTFHFRLSMTAGMEQPFADFDDIFNARYVILTIPCHFRDTIPTANFASRLCDNRLKEADEFYTKVIPTTLSAEEKKVSRQAYAGLLWSKQFFHYIIEDWLDGDRDQPPPPASRRGGRNSDWRHLFNKDVISMPDKWEYPWYATWDLAFVFRIFVSSLTNFRD